MARFHSISSPSNPLLKDIRRALTRGALTEQGLCPAESFHLLREALQSGVSVPTVIAAESVRAQLERVLAEVPEQPVALLPDRVFQSVAGTETSQGVIALIEPPRWTLEQLFRGANLLLVLDGVQDPGNAGTAARAAEAFGATGILFVKGTVNPYNSKTMRASAGSLFRIPYITGVDPVVARVAIQQNRLTLYAGMPWREGVSTPVGDADLRSPCALVIGNEGRGVSEEFQSEAIGLAIPTVGVESLNASIAAAILLYEAHRQRSTRR